MRKIEKNKLIHVKKQQVDDVGKIYFYEGTYIRIINKYKRAFVHKLFTSGCIKELVDKHILVETEIEQCIYEDEVTTVLKHRMINNPICPKNWTFHMIKDAALLVINMNKILNKYGLELKDCHVSNVLFDGLKPIYVDFGSISLKNGKWEKYVSRQFRHNYYYPLLIMARGYQKDIGMAYREAREIGGFNLENLTYMYYGLLNNKKIIECIDRITGYLLDKNLEGKIEKIQNKNNSYWKDYQTDFWKGKSTRFTESLELIKQCKGIETAIELGANQGYFSYLLSENHVAKKIIVTDYDYNAVDQMYEQFKKMNICSEILPGVVNILSLTNMDIEAYKSDLVVANALTHHLLLAQHMDIDVMFNIFSRLSKKYLLVEFMPLGLWTRKNGKRVEKGYCLEWFIQVMEKYFMILKWKKIDTNRIAILGEKLSNN